MLPPVDGPLALFDGVKLGSGLCKKNERKSTIAAQLKTNIDPAQPAPAQPCRQTVNFPRLLRQANRRPEDVRCA
jgi:hypothetical protein